MSLLTGAVASNDPRPRCADCGQYVENHKLGPNIHITGFTQPDDGCSVAMRCHECNGIEIAWSPWAEKPKDGDIWLLTTECAQHIKILWVTRPDFPKYDFSFTGWRSLAGVTHGDI